MTKIVVQTWESGRLVMKSNDKSCQIEVGIARGWSSPTGCFVSYLVCWQVTYWWMKWQTKLSVLRQSNAC